MCHIFDKNTTEYMQKNDTNVTHLRKVLPYGAIKEIANRSKVSRITVSRVLNKGVRNLTVMKFVKEYLEESNQLSMEINQLVSEAKA